MKLEQIQEKVRQVLSEKRYNHSLAVMQRCEELAQLYGADIEMARKVGIAHDIAKELKEEERKNAIKQYNIELDEIEKQNPGLLHAKIGAVICKNEFGFTQEMVQAVENHTTAKPKMDLLSKILFVADATGVDRNWSDLEYARKLSEINLDATIIYIIDLNIRENLEKSKQIHPNSIDARNELLCMQNE